MSTCAAAVTSFFSTSHVLFCAASLCAPLLSLEIKKKEKETHLMMAGYGRNM
jgi:hypothetical protein